MLIVVSCFGPIFGSDNKKKPIQYKKPERFEKEINLCKKASYTALYYSLVPTIMAGSGELAALSPMKQLRNKKYVNVAKQAAQAYGRYFFPLAGTFFFSGLVYHSFEESIKLKDPRKN